MMGKLWSNSKKETKNETVEKVQKKSTIISKSDGNISSTISTTTQMTRQISSTSQTESIVSRSNIISSQSPSSIRNNLLLKSETSFDATPFEPFRSTALNEPYRLTVPSLFNRNQPTRASTPKSFPVCSETNDFKNKVVINVRQSERFYDDPELTKVPVYKTRSKNKGHLLVINNIDFSTESIERVGAQYDENNLMALFKGIGFQITKYRNLNKKSMENNIKKFRDNNSLKKYVIATVIVMSHGTTTDKSDNTQVLCSDGNLLETAWIIEQFDNTNCKYLIGKPKIFIFQCCRGNNINMVQTDSAINPTPRQQSDMLIAHSTIPGFVSHRDPNNGTWYIQAICKVFMEHAYDTDVESLLKIVDDKLATLVFGRSKQTSSFENRGFKTCYLHPQLYE